jgi:hypothetical protein
MGRVNVPTPGTPVPLSTNTQERVAKVFVQVIPGLTGKTYFGRTGMNKTTLAGVSRILFPNASGGASETFFLESADAADSINLAEYAIDADIAGEGLLVSYWTE